MTRKLIRLLLLATVSLSATAIRAQSESKTEPRYDPKALPKLPFEEKLPSSR